MTAALDPKQNAWRWRILTATYIGYIGFYLTRKAFTICKTSIAAELGWELGDTAWIWAAFLIAYMIGQFVNGFAGRKWAPRFILLFGLGVSMVCSAIFGISNSFPMFLVFMFVNGLVQAAGWPGSIGAVSSWLRSEERGAIMGIWTTNHIVANIVLKSLGGFLLGMWGWRWCFFGLTAVTIAVWWLLYIWERDKPEDVGLDPIVSTNREDAGQILNHGGAHLSAWQIYVRLMTNPLIICMGLGYFCVKYLRYALDSWLPAFLNIQGLGVAHAAYYSQIFDLTGVVGTILAGFALHRVFRGNWAMLSFVMALGTVLGWLAVIYLGTDPRLAAIWFGLVGFMLYGPDSLLTGAAAIAVAGEANGVAVAGIVNGIGSVGPVIQEVVIGLLMRGDKNMGITTANWVGVGMSVALAFFMLVLAWQLRRAHAKKADLAASAAPMAQAK